LEGEEEGVWEGGGVCVWGGIWGGVAFVDIQIRKVGSVVRVVGGEVFVWAGEEERVFFYEGLEVLEVG
jgi:hypothetical protein